MFGFVRDWIRSETREGLLLGFQDAHEVLTTERKHDRGESEQPKVLLEYEGYEVVE